MKKEPKPILKSISWLKNLFLTVCLLQATMPAFSQTKTVTGTVTDALGEPLIGASVLVQGTSNGVITNIDGKYSIQVTPENTLEFSYVGMQKQAIRVGSQSVIDVQMKDDSQMLAETVVIGYGSAKKRDLTGSITNIKGDEIANKPVVNPVSALQGKVAGVQVINSGKAGAEPEIRVRGTNSINGYKPLYVVDGLFNDNINFLNPQDIESMEILKDPSSLCHLRCTRCQWCHHYHYEESQRRPDACKYQRVIRLQSHHGQDCHGRCRWLQDVIQRTIEERRQSGI